MGGRMPLLAQISVEGHLWAPREQFFWFTFIPVTVPEAEPWGHGSWIQRGTKHVGPYSGSHSVGTHPPVAFEVLLWDQGQLCRILHHDGLSSEAVVGLPSYQFSYLQSGWLQGHQLTGEGSGLDHFPPRMLLGPHANLHTEITCVYQAFSGQRRSFYLFPRSVRCLLFIYFVHCIFI